MDVLIGIDVGSSNLKVAALDRHGRTIARGQRPYREIVGVGSGSMFGGDPNQRAGGQDPEDWIDTAGEIIREMLATGAFRAQDVHGVAPCARGSAGVFVDHDGRVLAPLESRVDTRPHHAALVERFGPESDNRGLASATLAFKARYPDRFDRLAHAFMIHDFLVYRLSGVAATDPSSGPRRPERTWPEGVWEYIGKPGIAPPMRPHTDIVGTLLPETAHRLGLPAGIPVANGGHDGACANIGAGAYAIGSVCVTMGTNVVARSISDFPAQQIPWMGISAYHFLPGRWCCGGDAGYAGATATWLLGLLGGDHEALTEAARSIPPGSNGVTFLPFLTGQIAPHRRLEARGGYLGLNPGTDRATLYRATLEGVSYLYRSVRQRLDELGLGWGEWRVSGGGAQNPLWMEIMAALVERPFHIGESDEGSRGAAMCAAVGLGWYPDIESCGADWIRTLRVVSPDRDLLARYLPHYERYVRLADAVYEEERRG